MPTVSILMPVYNGEEFIREAIESILQQTFEDWELIIVNEFDSNEVCKQIVREYEAKDSRIIVLNNEKKLGISKSLNAGLAIAKGTYIARMDADDISFPLRLEKQVQFMEQNEQVGICGTDFEVRGENWKSNIITDKNIIKSDLLFFVTLRHPTIIMRKQTLDDYNLQYSNIFTAAEDYDLFVRASRCCELANLNEKLVIYRRHEGAAVLRNLDNGAEINRIIGKRLLEELNLNLSDYEIRLLYNHALLNWDRTTYEGAVEDNFILLHYLLLKIYNANEKLHIYEQTSCFLTLCKRWEKAFAMVKKSTLVKDGDLIDYIYENSLFKFENQELSTIKEESLISLVMPVTDQINIYGLQNTLNSILNQSYRGYEVILLLNKGISVEIQECLKEYSEILNKVNFIVSDRFFEETELLNKGIESSAGAYISFVKPGDILLKEKLQKQIVFLSSHKTNDACGSFSLVLYNGYNETRESATEYEDIKIENIFQNTLELYTLLIRAVSLRSHKLCFDSSKKLFEFDFIVKALSCMTVKCLPDKLLIKNSDATKYMEEDKINLRAESGDIVASNLKVNLNLDLNNNQKILVSGCHEILADETDMQKLKRNYKELEKIYKKIYFKNIKTNYFDTNKLLQRLSLEWMSIKYNKDRKAVYPVKKIQDVFKLNSDGVILTLWIRIKWNVISTKNFVTGNILKNSLNDLSSNLQSTIKTLFDNNDKSIENWSWDRYQRINADINKSANEVYRKLERKVDNKVWDAERRIIVLDDILLESSFNEKKAKYDKNEKVRIVVIFQVASFWPSIDTFYKSCKNDDRFDIKIMCYDELVDSSIKVETARHFLEEQGIEFEYWTKFNLDNFKPHVVLVQTPYDSNRRKEFKSNYLKARGYRVVYIPYGMEIGDTPHSRKQQLDHIVRRYSWKIYTFSDVMKMDYRLYSEAYDNIEVQGLPKFDALYTKKGLELNSEISKRADGKQIMLWKVHFPKVARVNGEIKLFTPEIDEYIKFVDYIKEDEEFFYVFMPHPRFKEFNDDKSTKALTLELLNRLSILKNVYIDDADDYRPTLVHSDYIIVDRSSVMVEAGASGVPVLFMSNNNFREPMTKAIEPLINSYYQGTSCQDMINFVQMCKSGEDRLKKIRQTAFHECIPYFDGKSGERIKNNILYNLSLEE